MLKIATWNVNSLNVRLGHLLLWLEKHQPDIVALQETKLTDNVFPKEQLLLAGYNSVFVGQKTYNGVALLSKKPFGNDIVSELPCLQDPQRRLIAATIDDIRIINVYIPNGQDVGSDKYHYKLAWLEHLLDFIRKELIVHPKVVVLGDYNIAPEDKDVHDPVLWQDQVLFSEPEKAFFKSLLHLGLYDSFRLFEQPEKSYSWWDYRQLAFRMNKGLRIDHILVSEPLKDKCVSCIIDKESRRQERSSDHAPVIACFN